MAWKVKEHTAAMHCFLPGLCSDMIECCMPQVVLGIVHGLLKERHQFVKIGILDQGDGERKVSVLFQCWLHMSRVDGCAGHYQKSIPRGCAVHGRSGDGCINAMPLALQIER